MPDKPEHSSAARRDAVLASALRTFARYGYRKTSMEDVAHEAEISRQGLYFLFSSKSSLFSAAAERGIEHDLALAEEALHAPKQTVAERIVAAFDHWAGRYVGPLRDVTAVLENNSDLLGPVARSGPERFERLLAKALVDADADEVAAITQTLISTSIGIKTQAADREEYRARMSTAVDLLTRRLAS